MRGIITVADSAQLQDEGKISALGAFWTTIKTGTVRSNLIIVFRLDSLDELGEHQWAARLVRLGADGDSIAEAGGTFSVTSGTDEAPEASDLYLPGGAFTLKARDVDLPPGTYSWELYCDEQKLDEWQFTALSESKSETD